MSGWACRSRRQAVISSANSAMRLTIGMLLSFALSGQMVRSDALQLALDQRRPVAGAVRQQLVVEVVFRVVHRGAVAIAGEHVAARHRVQQDRKSVDSGKSV